MGTLIVGGIVLAIAAGAIYILRRDKKNGRTCSGCSGNCGSGCNCGH